MIYFLNNKWTIYYKYDTTQEFDLLQCHSNRVDRVRYCIITKKLFIGPANRICLLQKSFFFISYIDYSLYSQKSFSQSN